MRRASWLNSTMRRIHLALKRPEGVHHGPRPLVAQALAFLLLLETTGLSALYAMPRLPEVPPVASVGFATPQDQEPSFFDRAWERLGSEVGEGVAGARRWGLQQAQLASVSLGAVGGWLAGGWLPAVQEAPPEPSPKSAEEGTPEVPPELLTDQVSDEAAEAGTAPQAPAGVSTEPPRPPGFPARKGRPAVPGAATVKTSALGDLLLLPSLNLASLPNEPPDAAPAAIFAPIASSVTRVFAYDNCDPADPWKVYDPADPAGSDLTALDHTQGFWIDVAASAVLPAAGSQPATTEIPLCTGWNLIGYPLAQPRPPLSALASIAPVLVRIYGYDAGDAQDPWEVFDPAVPPWASDLELMQPGRGYWVLVAADATLDYANAGPAPEVQIASPLDLGEVTTFTDVVGTVRSNLLERWSLSTRPSGEDAELVELATGTSPVEAEVLATFDPTLLLNGMVDLRLEAQDYAGVIVEETITVAVDGQQKIGSFTLSFVDLAVPLSGLDIEVVRTYDSRDKRQGDFGIGWTLDIRQGSYRNNRPPGDGWQIQEGFLPCDTVQESKSHLTTVRLSDVEVYRFALQLSSPAATGGGCFAEAGFTYVDGPLPGSTLEILGNTSVFYANASNEVIDANTFELYEPGVVRLTTRDGRIFDLDLAAGVTRLEDLNGNALEITEDGISHSNGVSIDFERDGEGRITGITDPRGESLAYAYDATGDLVAFTDAGTNVTSFVYDADHGLLDIIDPLGRMAVRSEYDDAGRLLRTTDSSGNTIELTHDLGADTEIVTNRLGQQRLLDYDARGNVTREVDELGNETLRTFDGEDNLLTETDPLGNTTTNTYDAGNNLLSVTDPLGNATTFTYDARGGVLTTTDARGNVTTNAYDAAGNLTSTTDAAGNVTSFTYDGAGNLLSETDAAGNVTTFEVDARGNVTQETDPLGNVTTYTYDAGGNRLTEALTRSLPGGGTETLTTTFTYDALGRLTSTIDPLGNTTTTVYDALGNVLRTTDPLGRETAFTYDGLGRLVRTTHPDGTSELQGYDAEGRLTTQIDRGGRVTTLTHDAAGRLTETRFADGATARSSYDSVGRLVASTDARNNTTSFEYDAAGRRTKVTDPLGNEMVFVYDASGNQTAVTDPRGNTTAFEYDALGRLTRTVFPDGTDRTVGYDALGRRVSETDQAGITTQFGYDALGHLTSVTDALGQVTGYTVDALGNRTAQTDANAHTTTFAYDALARQIGRTLPAVGDPPVTVTETFTYDVTGNQLTKTKFDGATLVFTYDAMGRLTKKSFPDGTEVNFTYTVTGQRSTVTDARGTTSYSYDERDRLIALTYPDGRALFYDYDPQGNRIALTAQIGETSLTTTYSYDALNRLATVTDPDGRVYTHAYDENGNRAALAYPNGVTTTYQYDSLNRLTNLTTQTSVGETVQSYAYTLGPSGNRTQIVEAEGRTSAYAYDLLYRLTGERLTDAMDTLVYENMFTYDPVGNRLQQDQTASDGTTTPIVYAYDERDRIITDDGMTYSWDGDGNLTSRSSADGVNYTWDFEDRLVAVNLSDGTAIEHTYSPDGVRVLTAVTSSGGGPADITDFLVDTSGALSQVVTETDGTGDLTAYYVRGDELLSLSRGSGLRFYHADGLGSIRRLTTEDVLVTDRYAFTAFGELLEHQGGDANGYLFAGERLDPNSGFYYNRARWLAVDVGRFVSGDPFPGLAGEPLTLHRYLYALARPTSVVDPTGRIASLTDLTVTLRVAIVNTLRFLNVAFRVVRTIDAIRDGIELAYWFIRAWRLMSGYPTPESAIQALVRDFGDLEGIGEIPDISDALARVSRFIGGRWEDLRGDIARNADVIGGKAANQVFRQLTRMGQARARGVGNFILYAPSPPGPRGAGDVPLGRKGKFEVFIPLGGGGRLFGFGFRRNRSRMHGDFQFLRIDYAEVRTYDPHCHFGGRKDRDCLR